MKESQYRLLTAAASGVISLATAIWCIAAAITALPAVAIALGIITIFLIFMCRVQLHDRRVALNKEDWRREPTELIEQWARGE